MVYQVRTNCEGDHKTMGFFADVNDEFGGLLFVAAFDPAGLSTRTPQEVYEASVAKAQLRVAMQMVGVCSRCSGTVTASLHFCDDHVWSGEDLCPNCGHRWGFRPMFTCTVCKYESVPDPRVPVGFHPAVIDFYADHDIRICDLTDPESVVRMERLLRDQSAELVSRDPARVRVTIRHGDDELQLTYDEAVNVIDVSEGT
jgi:hypothetical protein